MPDFGAAREFMRRELAAGVPSRIHYHGLAHAEAVESAAKLLCEGEGVAEGERRGLILAAALWHDAGFLVRYDDNESCACGMARRELAAFGFERPQIEAVCGMIMSTRMPQAPKSLDEMIVCDADLSSLGSDDAGLWARRLRSELAANGKVYDDEAWRRLQTDFLSGHKYFTATARGLWDAGKGRRLADLERGSGARP